MSDITIPPEAVEAAVQAYLSTPGRTASIRAAIRAALAAWPEAQRVSEVFTVGGDFYKPHIILPLPQKEE